MTATQPGAAASPSTTIRNAMTIDVEDYYQVSAFASYVPRQSWDAQESRVVRNVGRVLQILADHGASATFFTLGWIAERHPTMVQAIVDGGHELASHGYSHLRATEQSPEEFASDITRAKKLLEDLGGVEVRGYRAPSFSIGAGNLWALDAIHVAGYRYSSSIYPIRHDHYGMPEAPRFAHQPREHRLVELPATTVRVLDRNLPASGGGYFRLLPYRASRWLITRVNAHDGAPAIFYFHPWEIDAGQPRIRGLAAKARFRHYVNLKRTEPRVRRLLRDFSWDRVDRVFAQHLA